MARCDGRRQQKPARWFDRVERYRLAGADRSLLAVFQAAQKSPKKPNQISGSWKVAADEWRWQARAEAWDASIRAAALAVWEQDYQAAIVAHRNHALLLAVDELIRRLADRPLIENPMQSPDRLNIPCNRKPHGAANGG